MKLPDHVKMSALYPIYDAFSARNGTIKRKIALLRGDKFKRDCFVCGHPLRNSKCVNSDAVVVGILVYRSNDDSIPTFNLYSFGLNFPFVFFRYDRHFNRFPAGNRL